MIRRCPARRLQTSRPLPKKKSEAVLGRHLRQFNYGIDDYVKGFHLASMKKKR
jgi:hypothetical protein